MVEEDKKSSLVASLEALLFIYGEPQPLKKLAEILKVNEEETEEAVSALKNKFQASDSGLTITQIDKKIQLVTKPDFASMIKTVMKEEIKESLTPAALEALSIIAYCGPLNRSTIDYLRGVNSTYILRNLMVRGLVERKTDSKRSKAYLYEISFDFLKHLGLTDIRELPEFQRYKGVINNILNPDEKE